MSKGMTEKELGKHLDGEIRQCIGFSDDEISEERRRNLAYYLNDPRGDEEDGRSKLQDSTVADVVDGFLPGLLAPFLSSDRIAEFLPVEEDDDAAAEIATAYVNHIMTVDNDSVDYLHTFAKDGLLQKNGFIYGDWCMKKKQRRMQVRTDYIGLQELTNDKEIDIIAVHPYLDGTLVSEGELQDLMQSEADISYDVDFRRTWKQGRVVVQNVAPESVLVHRNSRTLGDHIVGWQDITTLSELREEGFDDLDDVGFADSGSNGIYDNSSESDLRSRAQQGGMNYQSETTDKSSRAIWRTVTFINVDYDGDGIAELRKIIRVGRSVIGGKIIYNEEVSSHRLITWTPVPMPYQVFGRALADQVISLQDWKTALLRSAMNGIYDTTEPRHTIKLNSCTETTILDYMEKIPGTPVVVKEQDALSRLDTSPDLGATFNFIEMADRVRDTRSPVPRVSNGIDPDILNNQSATAARIQHNSVSQRQELIVRLFADAVARLARLVYHLVVEFQDKPRMLRLMPEAAPVKIDPRFWNADMDVSVMVGLGTGTKDQQMNALLTVNQIQMADMQAGLPIVTIDEIYNTRSRIVEAAGLSSPEKYFKKPEKQMQSPELQQAYNKGVQEGQKMSDAAAKLQIEQMKIASNEKIKGAELQSKESIEEKKIAYDLAELQVRQQENIAQAAGLNV